MKVIDQRCNELYVRSSMTDVENRIVLFYLHLQGYQQDL